MKKVLGLFLAAVLLLGMIPAVYAAPIEIQNVYTLADPEAADSRADLKTIDGIHYLFLPSAVEAENLSLFFELNNSAQITLTGDLDSAVVKSGEAFNLWSLCTEAERPELKITAQSGSDIAELSLTLVFTTGMGSMFLVSEDPVNQGRTWVESSPDKSNKAKGSMYYCTPEGEVVYAGALTQIKGRGNSTWLAEKKPYQIKLDSKTDLLQTGDDSNKSKTWVLLTNASDPTGLRNNIVYDLSVAMGMEPGIQSEPINLYYDGEYRGTYLLCEKVEVGSGRVDIEDLEGANEDSNPEIDLEDLEVKVGVTEEGTSYTYCEGMTNPENYSGGYLLEMDTAVRAQAEVCYITTTRLHYIVVKSPEFCSKEEMEYIAKYYQNIEDIVYNGGVHPVTGQTLEEVVDVESLAECYIINELTKNPDGYRTSTYFYKDADSDILTVGPIWDYDLSFGRSWGEFIAPCSKPEGFFTIHSRFAEALYQIGAFRQAVHDIYLNEVSPLLNSSLLAEESASGIMMTMDGYFTQMRPSALANGLIWNISEGHFTDEVSSLENYISIRNAWLTENFANWNAETIVPLNNYIDVEPEYWYYEPITKATDYGILNGLDHGIFAPNGQTTRAMAAKVLFEISGAEKPEYSRRFSDVFDYEWFAPAVLWAAENGVVTGHEDGTFHPNEAITRQDMVVLMYRYLGSPEVSGDALVDFSDGDTILPYAVDAMNWAIENGIVQGYEDDGIKTVQPFNPITRAEMAAIVVRYYENFVMDA